jgi:hypothetical protein
MKTETKQGLIVAGCICGGSILFSVLRVLLIHSLPLEERIITHIGALLIIMGSAGFLAKELCRRVKDPKK